MNINAKHFVKTIAVASGKGGVGKTNVVANLAVALNAFGKKVLILDADLGLSNVDLLLPLSSQYGLQCILSGEKTLKEVMADGPQGIRLLAAERGVQELTVLSELQRFKLLEAFNECADDIDVLLIDTASGISENVAFFCAVAQEIVIVTDPEPMSIVDAFALIKTLNSRCHESEFSILVNSAKSADEALRVFGELSRAIEQKPSVSLDYLGHLPFDKAVRAAVRARRAFMELYPDCAASHGMRLIANKLSVPGDKVKGTLQFFIENHLSASRGIPRV